MQHLEIETPEHVMLDLEVAGVGSRGLAALIDMAILLGGTLGVYLMFGLLFGFGLVKPNAWLDALLILLVFGVWSFYFAFFEGLRRGQTPGKRAVGIRVVSDTGHAVTFGAATLRNLLRLADLLPPPYLTGIVLAALHPRGKRLGDLVAGTVVVRDHPAVVVSTAATQPAVSTMPRGVAVDMPELDDAAFQLVSQFHARQGDLPPATAATIAARLVGRLGMALPVDVTPTQYLLELHDQGLARRQGRLGGAVRSNRGFRFAEQKMARWDEFHRLANRAAERGLDSFAADELPDFAARYREIAADLARARTYGADTATLARLERLVAAGHNALYRDERHSWRQIWTVIARDCPAAVLQARGYVALAFLLFAGPAAAGFAMLRERPALAAEILPESLLRRAEAGAARQTTGGKYFTASPQDRPMVASGIISNNVRVAIACFAGGIFLGVGSLVLLAYNGLAIGATMGHFANAGLLNYLLEFVVGHGALELFAIWVAGAAGFLLGRAAVAPGTLQRADALALNGRIALHLVGAAVVMLFVAGTIEGFVSAGGGDIGVRVAASVVSLVFLALYLANGAYSSRSIPRMRMAMASTSRRLVRVSSSNLLSSSSNN